MFKVTEYDRESKKWIPLKHNMTYEDACDYVSFIEAGQGPALRIEDEDDECEL